MYDVFSINDVIIYLNDFFRKVYITSLDITKTLSSLLF